MFNARSSFLNSFVILTFLFGLLVTQPAAAQMSDSSAEVNVSVELLKDSVPPGADVPLAIIFDMNPGWHIYAVDADIPDNYFKTVIEVEVDGKVIEVNTGFMQLPTKHVIDFLGDDMEVYEGKAIAYLPLSIKSDAPLGATTITVRTGFQACDDMQCLQPTPMPGSMEWLARGNRVKLNIVSIEDAANVTTVATDAFDAFDATVYGKIHAGEAPPNVVDFDLFGWSFSIDAAGTAGFALLLLVAALGGLILNFTPCVLPMIPIKIMALSQSASNRGRTFALGLAMSVGIIVFWEILGIAIATLSGFTKTYELFRYPAFTLTVGAFIAIMAVGMCGVFSLKLPKAVYNISPKHDSLFGSFGFGIMAAVLSTPCTAPFMGAAAAWAATQETPTIMATFTAIGIGMAVPYLLLASFPALVSKMPRTGPASEVIKQVMGLLMLAAAAFFIGTGLSGLTVSPPDPPSKLYMWVVGGFVVMAGAWLMIRTIIVSKKLVSGAAFSFIGLLLVAAGLYLGIRMTDKGPIDWVYYTPDRFEQAKADGDIVVMEFTAEWCVNCKTLEQTVLRNKRIVELFHSEGITPIKVDTTNYKAADEMLESVGRKSIPLLVVFNADGNEVWKGDFYTVQQVVDAVEDARN